jgi:hypothetical protein
MKAVMLGKRSLGLLASALFSASSAHSGAKTPARLKDGTASVSCLAQIALGEGPLNGGSPTSIS